MMYNDARLAFSLDDYRKDDELTGLLELTDDDIFRWLHYHGGFERHHASDVDLVCVDANPQPHVAAFLEFKSGNESASFPQAVLFESLSELAPVYIVRSKSRLLETQPGQHRFSLELFSRMNRDSSGGWIETTTVNEDVPWGGHISGVGDLDPAFNSGIIGWEDTHRTITRETNGRPWAAIAPEDIRSWAGGVADV